MDAFQQWVFMGGHWGYVWSAYSLALVILVWNVWQGWRLHRYWRQQVQLSFKLSFSLNP